ncbi:MAG: ATPase domain-containing protein [bacterium]
MDELKKIQSGIENLDEILGGGIPDFSVNIITGPPGSGKTILTQQIMFNNATEDGKSLCFTTISEPALKMMRYQQHFDYFDVDKIGKSVIFIDIGEIFRQKGLMKSMETIVEYVEKNMPKVIVIDSFKALHELAETPHEVREFGYELAVNLTTWQAISFLVGEYTEDEMVKEPVFAVADGVFKLYTEKQGMQDVRFINISKMRGVNYFRGDHPFTISNAGIKIYPRIKTPLYPPRYEVTKERISTGVKEIDKMMGGGLPKGTSTLVAGGAGTGKTLLGLHFITEGIEQGEPGVIVSFQESPSQLYEIASGFGWNLEKMEREGKVKLLYTSPVELSVDEHTAHIKDVVAQIQAKRVVIDSLMDLEIATPNKVRYKDYVYSVVNFFKSNGITSLLTNEITELFDPLKITEYGISFIADNVVLLRYVELESHVSRALAILKARGIEHDKYIREFKITSKGLEILSPFTEYGGILSGMPVRQS